MHDSFLFQGGGKGGGDQTYRFVERSGTGWWRKVVVFQKEQGREGGDGDQRFLFVIRREERKKGIRHFVSAEGGGTDGGITYSVVWQTI